MKGKKTFTQSEADEIIRLIDLKVQSDTIAQKGIRAKIRRLGFRASDFDLRGGYTAQDFLNYITVMPDGSQLQKPSSASQSRTKTPVKSSPILKRGLSERSYNTLPSLLMRDKDFHKAAELDDMVPNNPGIYAIRISDSSTLPSLFREELQARGHDLIYVGIASQSLKRRMLGQELRARGHGTFFRSLGALLGYTPPIGSLNDKKNKRNYTFSSQDESAIVEWINENLLVNWVEVDSSINYIETELILEEKPLLNISKNPLAIKELSVLRAKCVEIANL